VTPKAERDARYDDKRRREKPWRRLYKTARWRAIRQQQLRAHPLCKRHLDRARVVKATVVHHVDRHNGDPIKFFAGPFESLCAHCHDSDAQGEERIGYSRQIGEDGFPVDPRHPMNRSP
jgi:hypothetical protein